MKNQIEDLMDIARTYADERVLAARGSSTNQAVMSASNALRDALEAALKPGEPEASIEKIATDRYKVVTTYGTRCAVAAGDGKRHLYLGPRDECESMARNFAGAFLDGAFVQAGMAALSTQTPPTWWPAIEAIFNEYGLQAIDFVADWKKASQAAGLHPAPPVHTPPRLTEQKIMEVMRQVNNCNSNDEANTSRLVACWNACDGLSTEFLEQIDSIQAALTGQLIATQAAEVQCAELLDALKGIMAVASVRIDDPRIAQWDTARAAIAKATADRKQLQAAGLHPAPCAKHCEAKSFQIEIRRLTNALKLHTTGGNDE